jgi:hypothetical protein
VLPIANYQSVKLQSHLALVKRNIFGYCTMLVHVVTLHTAFSHSFTVFCIPSAVCEQVLGNMADHDESLSVSNIFTLPEHN